MTSMLSWTPRSPANTARTARNHDRIKEKLKGLSPVEYRTQALVPG